MSGRVLRWLCCDWVQGVVDATPNADYASVWGRAPAGAEVELVEQRSAGGARAEDPLDDLVGAAPERVRDWMVRTARRAPWPVTIEQNKPLQAPLSSHDRE